MGAQNAKILYESFATLVDFVALIDQGDQTVFKSAANFWSRMEGQTPNIKPNGLVLGGAVIPAVSGINDLVDVAAAKAYLSGVLTTVAADIDVSITRPDASYLLLSFAAAAYTACVASDIGKAVVGGTTTDSGTLIAYNNTTRQWVIDPDEAGDTFDDNDEAITITTGTGAGTLNAIGVAAPYKIISITINSSGAFAAVEGTQGAAFSTSRGAIGGPPWIPTTSIEIRQVKLTSSTPAAITAAEIFSGIGVHVERYDLPSYSIVYGEAESGVLGDAGVTFKSALPLIHSDNAGVATAAKKVYAKYYEPTFAQVDNVTGFTTPEKSHSVSSTQIYDGVLVSVSESLGAGGFTAYLNDGVSDSFLALKNKTAWFQFYPDKNQTVYLGVNGKLGIKRSWPASGGDIAAACTISALEEGIEVYS